MKTKTRRNIEALRNDRSGVAALEIALVAPFLLVVLGGTVDLSIMIYDKDETAKAISSGLEYAVLAEQAGTSTSTISTNVGTLVSAQIPTRAVSNPVVTVSVNNGAASGDRCCVTFSGGVASWTCAASAPVCSDGSDAGLYMQVTTSYAFRPLLPEDSFLAQPITSTAIRRIM